MRNDKRHLSITYPSPVKCLIVQETCFTMNGKVYCLQQSDLLIACIDLSLYERFTEDERPMGRIVKMTSR